MTKTEAKDFLAVGMRTLERYTSEGRLIPDKIKGKNGPTLDYRREDLERLKSELAAPLPSPPTVAVTLATGDAQPQGTAIVRVMPPAITLAKVSPPPSPQTVPIFQKMTLSLDEAAALSGFSSRRLRQAINEKALHAVRVGRGWRLRGEDLKAFVDAFFNDEK